MILENSHSNTKSNSNSNSNSDSNSNSNSNSKKIIFAAFLYLLICVQIVGLIWIIEQIAFWTHQSDEDLDFILLGLPILIFVLFLPFLIKVSQKESFMIIIKKIILPLGFLIQAIVSWLLYAQIHRFSFFSFLNDPNEEVLNSGWLSTDVLPLNLVLIWVATSFLVVIPTLICLLCDSHVSSNPKSLHLAGILFGLIMAFRLGSTLTWMFQLFLIDLISLPLLLGANSYFSKQKLILNSENKSDISNQNHLNGFPFGFSLALFFIMAFWWFVIEIQLLGRLSTTYFWLTPVIGNFIFFILDQMPFFQIVKKGKLFWIFTWISLEICSLGICLINLGLGFMNYRFFWLICGCLLATGLPQFLHRFQNEKPLNILQMWILIITTIIGLLFSIVPNLYDPYTSYGCILIWILNGLFSIPFLLKTLKSNPQ